MVGEAVVGEFASALRAQITEARTRLEAARAAKDAEAIASYLPRLRYLLQVAVENGVEVADEDGAPAERAELDEG